MRCWQSGQLQERTAGGILGDATEKLRAPNDVCANRRVSRLVLEDLMGNEQECESAERNVNMQAVDNAK